MGDEKSGARRLTDEELRSTAAGVPLPPEDLDEDLDNSGSAKTASKLAASAEVAVLDFVDGAPGRTLTLFFPFRLDGREVREITVRPLIVAEVSAALRAAPPGEMPDNYDLYAVMTGLPAPVLRALPGPDGERVTEVAFDFLPRFMKDGSSLPIPGDGGA